MIRSQSVHAFVAAVAIATIPATADADIADPSRLPMPESHGISATTSQTSIPADGPSVSYARAMERPGARALLRDGTGVFNPLLLPRGEQGRRRFDDSLGNKAAKLDLEAGVVIPDGRFIALGSGSTSRRERIAVVWPDRKVDLREAGEFYDLLRNTPQFAGAKLNLEGAVVVGDRLRLFQRGDSAPTETTPAVNATADVDLTDWVRWLDGEGPLPRLLAVVQYDLGTVDGVPLAFTDAAALSPHTVVFLAGAEASVDAVHDGAVAGCRVGLIDGEAVWIWDIRDEQGELVCLKLEGIEPLDDERAEPQRFAVVSDMDRADQPSLIGILEIHLGDATAAQGGVGQ